LSPYQILKWESTLADVTEAALLEAFQVNCIGALMLTRALLPLIARSEQKQIVNISSGFASITDNSSSRCYSYRISKRHSPCSPSASRLTRRRTACSVLPLSRHGLPPTWA
jgi:short-subunit dehydrogenase involved in D-alanine esterification of teichoic acids